jgi:threonine dehydratase
MPIDVTPRHIELAMSRIAPMIRHTPAMRVSFAQDDITDHELWLKLENLQITGSFKVRGALNKVLQLPEEVRKRGLVTASGGNHGMAVAYAGQVTQVPVTVFLGKNVPQERAERLRDWGAKVEVAGANFDEACDKAAAYAALVNASYLHAFSDPDIIAGQGTIGLEILDQVPRPDVVIITIGGGGLIAGAAVAIKSRYPNSRIIGVEAAGAAKMIAARLAGKPVSLSEINTKAVSIAPKQTTQLNLDLIKAHVDEIVTVTDEEMIEGCRWLWRETQVAGEMAAGATIAALKYKKFPIPAGASVCCLVCGSGKEGLI